VVNGAIIKNYYEAAAKVLREPALVQFMQSKLNAISPELRQEPLVKDVSEQLGAIEKLVSFPEAKVPTAEDVKKLNEAVGKLMTKIESKD
jgi:hypothetical protein